ncbi:MAG: dihydrodipicolinate synthase family protein [Chloroflexota bacterium]|nr:dihydrodipicolinate synthase family protein [Chloroflexota bacterium]
MSLQLTGIIPPLVTPFVPGSEDLDEQALRAEVRYLLDAGVHGLTLCGSTGEGHALSLEETVRCAEIAVEESRGRVPIVVGIIRDSTREVIRYAKAIERVRGVDALQITPVHYLFSSGPAGTYAYYREIGEAVGLPIVIYNVVPWNTISPETLLWLSEIPAVIAVKQSGGDIHKLAELLRSNRGRLQVLTAVDDLLYPSFMLGAQGAITAVLTIVPDLAVALWDACQRGDHAAARGLHERIVPIWTAINHADMSSRTKAAVTLRGRTVGPPRSPLLPVTDQGRDEIASALREAGVLHPAGAREPAAVA